MVITLLSSQYILNYVQKGLMIIFDNITYYLSSSSSTSPSSQKSLSSPPFFARKQLQKPRLRRAAAAVRLFDYPATRQKTLSASRIQMAHRQSNNAKYTTCICMVGGLPGAGKTSLVQVLKSTSPGESNKAPTVFYISFDRVYNLAQQGPFDANAWRDSRKCIFQKVEQLVSCLESRKSVSDKALLQGVDIFSIPETAISTSSLSVENIILLDDNFYYKSMRHVFFKIAQEKRVCFGQLFLKTSVHTCMERNRLRTGVEKVPETVIERMDEIFGGQQLGYIFVLILPFSI